MSGLHLTWHRDALEEFIHHANANPDSSVLPVPHWLTEFPGGVSVGGFVRDTMAFLGEICDGINGPTLLVTSTVQMDQLSIRMGHVEMHPFVQACMNRVDEDTPLVVVRRVIDVTVPEAQYINIISPPGHSRQMFQ